MNDPSPDTGSQPGVALRGAREIVMTEWLGRGGFAHTAEAWVRELRSVGRDCLLVTRAGREVASAVRGTVAVSARTGRLGAHLAVVRTTVREVAERQPSCLVLHGSVLPQLEVLAVRAARRHGVPVVLVAHEPAIGRRTPGAARAYARLVGLADIVVCHSHYVAEELRAMTGRGDFEVIPHPLPHRLVEQMTRARSVVVQGDLPLALSFGHLHRPYKGVGTVVRLARLGVPGWRIALVGKGAPRHVAGAVTVARFLDGAELAATVAAAEVVVLPYSRASQSGAVVLAQAVGAVVVTTAVGGLPEQVADGISGRLLPARADVGVWRDAVLQLSDADYRRRLAASAREEVRSRHDAFSAGIRRLVS